MLVCLYAYLGKRAREITRWTKPSSTHTSLSQLLCLCSAPTCRRLCFCLSMPLLLACFRASYVLFSCFSCACFRASCVSFSRFSRYCFYACFCASCVLFSRFLACFCVSSILAFVPTTCCRRLLL
jgi:hypothetical protein